jgi:hypothetical protein
VQFALRAQTWRKGISLTEARLLGWMSGEAELSVVGRASSEEVVRAAKVRSVVCGHTHSPTMKLAAMNEDQECYFIDVGTWRHRIPFAYDESGFGSLKSLTYLILYGSEEDQEGNGSAGNKLESFDYWSGISQRFYD